MMILTLSATVCAAKAKITVDKTSCSVTAGKSVTISVSSSLALKAETKNKYVACVSYDADNCRLTIKGVDFGTTQIKVYESSKPKNYQIINVTVKIPKVSGKWEENSGLTKFKLKNGNYAVGWNNIDGMDYYFYPNGVVNNAESILYNGCIYGFQSNGRINKLTDFYYILNPYDITSKCPERAEDILDGAKSAKGTPYCSVDWADENKAIGISCPNYYPGSYFDVNNTAYCVIEKYETDLYFKDVIEISNYWYAEMINSEIDLTSLNSDEKDLYSEKNLVASMSKAFGKEAVGNPAHKDALSSYKWSGIGVERADVFVYFYNDKVLITTETIATIR